MIKKKWLFLHFIANLVLMLVAIHLLKPIPYLVAVISLMIGYVIAISQMRGEDDD